jgi:hypothetical protein
MRGGREEEEREKGEEQRSEEAHGRSEGRGKREEGGQMNITAAFQVLDRLREARRLLEGSASAPLVVETVLLELRAAVRPH